MATVNPYDPKLTTNAGRSDMSMSDTASVPVVEAPIAPPAEVKEDAMSPRLVELARRTKAQRALQLKLQAQEQAVEKKRMELEQKQREYEQNYIPRDRFKADPLGVFAEMGITPEQLQQFFTQNPTAGVDIKLQQALKRIEELENGSKNVAKSQEEAIAQQYQAALNQIRTDTKLLVASDPAFETIKEMQAEDEVVNLIEKVFNEGAGDTYPKGHVLSVTEAAQQVEDYLVEEALRMSKLNKVKQKLAAPTEEAATKQEQETNQPTKQAPPLKTLTNSMIASPAKPITAQERRARAIAIAEGRLQP